MMLRLKRRGRPGRWTNGKRLAGAGRSSRLRALDSGSSGKKVPVDANAILCWLLTHVTLGWIPCSRPSYSSPLPRAAT